jgi:hypothetical protein
LLLADFNFRKTFAENSIMSNASGRSAFRLMINGLLIFVALITMYSGMALQLGFHVGGKQTHTAVSQNTLNYTQIRSIDTERRVSGFNYAAWSLIHKASVVIFSLLILAHCLLHRKWYQHVFSRLPLRRNTMPLVLTILFVLVALSGFWPWITDLAGGSTSVRMFFIEVHDKIALLFGLFLLFHFIRRISWYKNKFRKSR